MTTFGLNEFEADEVKETERLVKFVPAPTVETEPATLTDWFNVKSSRVITAACDANDAVIAKANIAILDFIKTPWLCATNTGVTCRPV